MENYLRIKGKNGLVRDMTSGAIINIDKSEYAGYVAKKMANEEIREKLDRNTSDIENIKTDLAEIKQLLVALTNKDK